MTRDNLENLWPWFTLKDVQIWSDAGYREVVEKGLKIQVPHKRVFVLEGESVIPTQDWGPNTSAVVDLGELVSETYVIGSCREPGWIVDAIREGSLTGCSI